MKNQEAFVLAGFTKILPQAEKANCSKCKKGVWVSPASKKIIQEKKAKIICLLCCGDIKQSDIRMTKEQLQEIANHEKSKQEGLHDFADLNKAMKLVLGEQSGVTKEDRLFIQQYFLPLQEELLRKLEKNRRDALATMTAVICNLLFSVDPVAREEILFNIANNLDDSEELHNNSNIINELTERLGKEKKP